MIFFKNNNNNEYMFVYVNTDGSVREVTILEKIYLQTKYEGSDGERPYIKTSYTQKDGRGSMQGFCYRSKIPKNISTLKNNIVVSKDQISNELERLKKKGYEVDMNGIEF